MPSNLPHYLDDQTADLAGRRIAGMLQFETAETPKDGNPELLFYKTPWGVTTARGVARRMHRELQNAQQETDSKKKVIGLKNKKTNNLFKVGDKIPGGHMGHYHAFIEKIDTETKQIHIRYCGQVKTIRVIPVSNAMGVETEWVKE